MVRDITAGSASGKQWYTARRHFFIILAVFVLFPASGQNTLDFNAVRAQDEFRWGVLAFHRGLYNEAILSFEKSLVFRPEITLPRLWLGRAYYMSGFEDAALNEWRSLLRLNQGTAVLQNLVEVIAYRRGMGRELNSIDRYVSAIDLEGNTGRTSLFMRPAGIHPRNDGSFLVNAYASNEILVFSPTGYIRQRLKNGFEGYNHPFDIVSPDPSFFFVSEYSSDRILKCSAQGNKLLSFGKKGRGNGELLGPQYLAVDKEGYLYVSEWGNRRISKFDFNGTFVLSFGKKNGTFPGFSGPTGIAVVGDKVFVNDTIRKTVDVFDTSGNYLSSLARGELHAPEGLQPFADGILLIADSDRIVALDVERDSIAVLFDTGSSGKRLTHAVPDINGNIIVSDFDANTVSILSEVSSMYSGLSVRIDRVNADKFPEITCEVTVETRLGSPVAGLLSENFVVTEDRAPVSGFSMLFSGSMSDNVSVAFLVDRSRQMIPFSQVVREATLRAAGEMKEGDLVRVVTAGELPVVEYAGSSVPDIARAAAEKGSYSSAWKFDIGLRLAASELLPDVRKKSVVFMTTGSLPRNAFERYGLSELVQYLRNNGILFNVVDTDGGELSEELEFIVRETGGSVYSLVDPAGSTAMIRGIRNTISGKYLLRYRSVKDSDFGRAYIPIEIEASLLRRSGRDEAGYFSQLR